VAEVKNYGLSGVHRTLQLGKQGPVLVGNADTDSFSVTLQDAATLTNMSGANATSGTHFITKSQLDAVYTEATFLANVNYNDSSPILLGNISYGTKTIITTFEVTTAFDDPAAIVTVGDSSDNSLLMSDSYAEIEVAGTYQTVNVVEFASNSTLNIYVTQAGATQGAGTVLVSVVDGPVVNGGAINYGAAGGNAANVGEFVFTDTTLTVSGLTNEDMYVKAIDDLFLDALDDDVHLRASDDIRFRTGHDFAANTYTWELRYTDGGLAIFYNYTAGNDYGYIRPVDDAGSLGMSYEGLNDVYLKSNNGDKTWKFANNGDLILPPSGDIKNSSGTSVLGTGGISLSNISVTSNSPSGNGSLSYDNTTGVFTFTPAAVSGGNYSDSNVATLLSSFGSNTIFTSGNVTTGILRSTATIFGNVDVILGDTANASAAKTRLVSFSTSSYIQTGNGTIGSTGNIVFSPYSSTDQKVVINTASGNITALGNVAANNFIGNISITGNVAGTSPNVSLVAGSYTATFDNTGVLTLPAVGGDEGGEINFGVPTANTSLLSTVKLDVYQDRIRFFDGSTKGAYIDLSQAGSGVGTLLNNRVSGIVNAGTFVTMDNIKATVTTSGSRGLSLATVSGSFACNIGGNYGMTSGGSGGQAGTLTITTTASSSVFGWGFFNQGDTSTYIITDTTNSRAYRITLQIGNGYNNNMISIERLI
jgi:hypothetical protein